MHINIEMSIAGTQLFPIMYFENFKLMLEIIIQVVQNSPDAHK